MNNHNDNRCEKPKALSGNSESDLFVKSENNSFSAQIFNPTQTSDIKDLIANYKTKTNKLPLLMDDICLYIGKYVSGNMPADRFSALYLSRMPNFYKRITTGEEHKQYSESYKNEIKMIKTIAKACSDFNNHQDKNGKISFDSVCEKAVTDYLISPNSRTKEFVL